MEDNVICSWVVLGGFVITCALVIRPFRLSVPCLNSSSLSGEDETRYTVKLDFVWAGSFMLGALLLMGCIDVVTIAQGVVGSDLLQPYSIMLLFLSLAYLSISLDATGLFQAIAYGCLSHTQSSLVKLYAVVFGLSTVLTLLTSNDVVVMTLTPVISSLASQSGLDPRPLLFIQFYSANIWSASLYIGNPTNVIMAESAAVNFVQYSIWNALPTIAAGLVMLVLTTWVMWPLLQNGSSHTQDSSTKTAPEIRVERKRAVFGSLMMGLSVISVFILTFTSVPIFLATLPFALILLVTDYLIPPETPWTYQTASVEQDSLEIEMGLVEDESSEMTPSSVGSDSVQDGEEVSETTRRSWRNLQRMPWEVVPFVLSMFILVEALDGAGWIDKTATILSNIIGEHSWLCALVMISTASIACNIMNNQPMAILFARIIQSNSFMPGREDLSQLALFSVALASNFGANLTLIGSLAGIMWSSILARHSHQISATEFMKTGCKIMPWVILSACFVLLVEYSLS